MLCGLQLCPSSWLTLIILSDKTKLPIDAVIIEISMVSSSPFYCLAQPCVVLALHGCWPLSVLHGWMEAMAMEDLRVSACVDAWTAKMESCHSASILVMPCVCAGHAGTPMN